jgi:hypothetical protein
MKIETVRIKGTILVLVISVMALISVVLLFLSSASSTMTFQANQAYLQACERNLISSGLSWAKTNVPDSIPDINEPIRLDVSEMNILNSSLDIKFLNLEDKQREVQIKTSCGRSRLNLSSSETYVIE